MSESGDPRTRARLLDAAMELMSQRGFDGVSVGDIESAAGLAPRSGALHKYFRSKEELLRIGLQQHVDSVAGLEVDLPGASDDSVEVQAEVLARWLLAELDRERTATHLVEREGARLTTLRDTMRHEVSERGYRLAADALVGWSERTGQPIVDCEALAVLLVGSLVNIRRSTWTFGGEPIGVDDDRAVAAFVDLVSRCLGVRD